MPQTRSQATKQKQPEKRSPQKRRQPRENETRPVKSPRKSPPAKKSKQAKSCSVGKLNREVDEEGINKATMACTEASGSAEARRMEGLAAGALSTGAVSAGAGAEHMSGVTAGDQDVVMTDVESESNNNVANLNAEEEMDIDPIETEKNVENGTDLADLEKVDLAKVPEKELAVPSSGKGENKSAEDTNIQDNHSAANGDKKTVEVVDNNVLDAETCLAVTDKTEDLVDSSGDNIEQVNDDKSDSVEKTSRGDNQEDTFDFESDSREANDNKDSVEELTSRGDNQSTNQDTFDIDDDSREAEFLKDEVENFEEGERSSFGGDGEGEGSKEIESAEEKEEDLTGVGKGKNNAFEIMMNASRNKSSGKETQSFEVKGKTMGVMNSKDKKSKDVSGGRSKGGNSRSGADREGSGESVKTSTLVMQAPKESTKEAKDKSGKEEPKPGHVVRESTKEDADNESEEVKTDVAESESGGRESGTGKRDKKGEESVSVDKNNEGSEEREILNDKEGENAKRKEEGDSPERKEDGEREDGENGERKDGENGEIKEENDESKEEENSERKEGENVEGKYGGETVDETAAEAVEDENNEAWKIVDGRKGKTSTARTTAGQSGTSKPKTGKNSYSRSKYAANDTDDYLKGYPDNSMGMSLGFLEEKTSDDKKKQKNFLFYTNQIPSKPDGDYIDKIHAKWWGNYDRLESHHGYIQWLFPIQEQGLNWSAHELQKHEIKKITADEDAYRRVRLSYMMMLDFYGMRLKDDETGELERAKNWEPRFKHLNRSYHNYLRITRILKCLGELGYDHYQFPLVRFFLEEAIQNGTLSNARDSCTNYWVHTVKDDEKRNMLIDYTCRLAEKNPKKFSYGGSSRWQQWSSGEEDSYAPMDTSSDRDKKDKKEGFGKKFLNFFTGSSGSSTDTYM